MNYKIVEVGGKYSVFEVQTDQIIRTYNSITKAKILLRHLNFGGGFDSWTPNFFLKPIQKVEK